MPNNVDGNVPLIFESDRFIKSAALVALFIQPNRSLISVLMKVRYLQPAGGREPGGGIQKIFQDGKAGRFWDMV
jgi:hypothetical protein